MNALYSSKGPPIACTSLNRLASAPRGLTKKVLSGGPGDSGASGSGSDGPPDKTWLN
jgi:hypothetical protein